MRPALLDRPDAPPAGPPAIGWWLPDGPGPVRGDAVRAAVGDLRRSVLLVRDGDSYALADCGTCTLGRESTSPYTLPVAGYLPPIDPRHLGDPAFCRDHGLRFPYVSGAMANGIASADLVEAMSRAGLLGFFGAAGLSLPTVEAAVERLQQTLGDAPFGFNLIHSPNEPAVEASVVDLYIRRGVRLVEASAFLDLTLPVVRYRVHGIARGSDGHVYTPNRVVAKVSRVEVASKIMAPPPEKFLRELVRLGDITEEQSALAARVPMAQDVTVEADSGGHTDNRPLVCLLPTMLALRDRLQKQYGYAEPVRVGAGGGIATPASTSAAFAMGAAYVVTGTVNQACVESGSSDTVRTMLAQAEQADVAMAPAADMFEMGVKVQVLKRGTMFPMRASKLYELYKAFSGIESIPPAERSQLEKNVFRAPLEEIWRQTREYFLRRDPAQVPKAEADAKHKMALVFRWYLGQASRWANAGEPTRQLDYQVWCGPAMGAFNEWAKGSFLEEPRNREVVTVALNLIYGAAVTTRLSQLRCQGVTLPMEWQCVRPMERAELEERLR
jgi:PfaD family protein